MKTTYLLRSLFACLFLFVSLLLWGQTDEIPRQYVKTASGNVYVGTIVSEDRETITIESTEGTFTLQREEVVAYGPYAELNQVQRESYHLQASRYYFGPNGYGLRQGEGYYQNANILFNSVSYGVTDNFSIGGGLVPLFLFGGFNTPTPIYVLPKFSVPIVEDKLNLGAGALIGTLLGGEETGAGFVGTVYGVSTFGSRNKNLSIGLGYGFVNDSFASTPTVSLSGSIRISEKSYLMTENYLIDGFAVGILGGRTVWESVSLDYGLILPYTVLGDGGFVAAPWLSLIVPFGD